MVHHVDAAQLVFAKVGVELEGLHLCVGASHDREDVLALGELQFLSHVGCPRLVAPVVAVEIAMLCVALGVSPRLARLDVDLSAADLPDVSVDGVGSQRVDDEVGHVQSGLVGLSQAVALRSYALELRQDGCDRVGLGGIGGSEVDGGLQVVDLLNCCVRIVLHSLLGVCQSQICVASVFEVCCGSLQGACGLLVSLLRFLGDGAILLHGSVESGHLLACDDGVGLSHLGSGQGSLVSLLVDGEVDLVACAEYAEVVEDRPVASSTFDGLLHANLQRSLVDHHILDGVVVESCAEILRSVAHGLRHITEGGVGTHIILLSSGRKDRKHGLLHLASVHDGVDVLGGISACCSSFGSLTVAVETLVHHAVHTVGHLGCLVDIEDGIVFFGAEVVVVATQCGATLPSAVTLVVATEVHALEEQSHIHGVLL